MSNTENWENVKEIFVSALDIEPGDRDAFVSQRCRGNSALLAEVNSWLASHAESGEFIETPALSREKLFQADSDAVGRQFGNYRIIREIGHGGMGAVYLAKRIDGEFEQEVALKIVRQSIAEDHTIERFRRERQILATLNHPNIAKLLDGGVSERGEPFLAMEFVEGENIMSYVTKHRLSLNEKLRLFQKVCSAVGYAHRNLVVHRDIKPGNILVTADGEPKLLDFGLAKLLSDGLIGDPDVTQTEFRALTPAYASPEQLRGEALSTASDTYSLGVVLYELLTGERPFHFEGRSIDEIIRTTIEVAPPSPSRLPGSDARLRGDLDNIVLNALRREPERRYGSVELFAGDIERHLAGLPVTARPNTYRYRAGKFLRRHKFGAAAAALLLVTLSAGVGATMWQARAAQRQKLRAEAVNAFLQNMLNYSDNSTGLSLQNGHETTVRDVLNDASERLSSEDLSGQPEIKAELQRIIGASYLSQGDYASAERNLNSALEVQKTIFGDRSVESLSTLVDLGQLKLVTGDTAGAERIYDQRVDILRREQQNGNLDPTILLVALNDYALVKRAKGDSAGAEALLNEALSLRPRIPAEGKIALGVAESVYALILTDRGDYDDALPMVRARISEIRSGPNPENSELAANLNALGNFLTERGDLVEAEAALAESERIYRMLFKETSVPLGDNLRLQARVLYLTNRLPQAAAMIEGALDIYRRSAGPNYINIPSALCIKGAILGRMGRAAEAEQTMHDAVERRSASFPDGHFLRAETDGWMGEFLTGQRRYAEAEPVLLKSLADLESSQAPGSPRLILANLRLRRLYQEWGKPDLAERY